MTTKASRAWDAAACSQCGHEGYRKHFLYRDGKPYCDDCAAEIGLTEENTERVT